MIKKAYFSSLSRFFHYPYTWRNVFFHKKSLLYMKGYFPSASRRERERRRRRHTSHGAPGRRLAKTGAGGTILIVSCRQSVYLREHDLCVITTHKKNYVFMQKRKQNTKFALQLLKLRSPNQLFRRQHFCNCTHSSALALPHNSFLIFNPICIDLT